jgi:hypothetical protein
MTYQNLPPIAELAELLEYEPETGVVTWKKNRSRTAKKGSPAGCISSCGYMQIMINRKKYMLHRIAWIMGTGSDPIDFEIDHVNGDKTDNRLSNLRKASRAENTWNQAKPKSNTSGYKGVSWNKKCEKWVAYIGVEWRRIHLGCFETKEAAHAAYSRAADQHHGAFANFN